MEPHALNEIIWQVVAAIPLGKVASYGQVARLAGSPNHARYVGTTLKKLPADTALPWHRVLNAKGEIAFASGTNAFDIQRERLLAEGVVFLSQNRVDLNHCGWSD